jgi:ADP-ribose pyrophosphatase
LGNEWLTLGRRYLHRSPWFAFRLDKVRLPDGAEIEYGVLEGRSVAVVLAITADGRMPFVEQWRQPLGALSLSLPGGMVDPGESPEVAAARELFEETGYRAEGLSRLLRTHPSPGRSTESCYVFRCRAVADGGPAGDETEFLRAVTLGEEEVREAVRQERITDAVTLLALYRAGLLPG